ncbi:MAG: 3-methyl-2-oxobutanoate hydroxymethyltransferase [bacterium]
MNKITIQNIIEMKRRSEKIAMLTCYHNAHAKQLNDAGVDIILVGDSLNMVLLGNENTLSCTVDQMLLFTKAVKKGNSKALLVADMPFLSYGVSVEDSVRNAGRFFAEAGAEAVKIEGGEKVIPVIEALVKNNMPVMGHLGLTPQSLHQLGGFKIQGRTREDRKKIRKDAKLLEKAGVFAIVLECIPYKLAKIITEEVSVPTIGIGAGKYCDGQVLVIDDLLGMDLYLKLKFVKKYLNLGKLIPEAVKSYIDDVKNGKFPDQDHSF